MKIKNSYDVVVAGVGPGGSAVAKTCAEADLDVLAVEKRAEIGAPKRCGEGLSRSSRKRMGIKLPKNCISQTISGATVYAPNKKFARIDFDETEGWIVERKVFDKYLAAEAAKSGAKILAKTELVDPEKKEGGYRVTLDSRGEKKDVDCRMLIAADGVESKIARKVGLNTLNKTKDICSCAQFEMAGVDIDTDRIEFFFNQEMCPGGYFWIFPKSDHTANVGLGIRKPWAKKTAYQYLLDWVDSMPGLKKGSVIEVNAGGVPVGGLMKDMVSDNFMVVGDAAHHVNPIHGGGISEAYVGGRIAAEVAVDAMKSGNCSKKSLEKYNRRWWEERGDRLQRIVKLRKVLEALSNEELNFLVEYLKGADLIDLSKANKFTLLAKILMKKPKMALLARKLM